MIKKSKHTNLTSTNKSLSIQFSLDGFSFCIRDISSKEIISFTSYEFDRTLATPELLLEKVSSIFIDDKTLQSDFKEINVIHQNNLSTIVPSEYFDPKELKNYLGYNIKTLANDYITHDDFTKLDAKNIYIPFVNLNNYLFQNFGSFEYKHHSTILIDKLLDHSKHNLHQVFYVNVYKNHINIIITQGDKLILYNSFDYQTEVDFIYYILFVAEQLEMNPDEFPLVFLGDIDNESTYYDITYKYVRNVDFIKTTSDFFTDSEEFNEYSNYILVS